MPIEIDLTYFQDCILPDVSKNHEALCQKLNVPYKSNGSTTKERKKWEEQLLIEKLGQRLIVYGIKEKTDKPIDGRSKGNNSNFINYIEPLLLDHFYCLIKDKKTIGLNEYIIDKKIIYTDFCLCGYRFFEKTQGLTTSSGIKISSNESDSFKKTIGSDMKAKVDNALKRLIREKQIQGYEDRYFVTKIGLNKKITGKVATDEVVRIIEDIKSQILKELGLEKESDVYKSKHKSYFYKRVDKLLKQKAGFEGCYKKIIVKIDRQLKDISNWLLDDEVRLDYMKKLNEKFLESIKQNAKNRLVKNKDKIETCKSSQSNSGKFKTPCLCEICSSGGYVLSQKYAEKWVFMADCFIDASDFIDDYIDDMRRLTAFDEQLAS